MSLGMRTWISETTCVIFRGGRRTHVETFLSDSSDDVMIELVSDLREKIQRILRVIITLEYAMRR